MPPPPPARVLICAPSNAAIDEVVVRLLHPTALRDSTGKPLQPRLVRVGAGKRGVDRAAGAKAQHNGVDIDAVSLDTLVAARMRDTGNTLGTADDSRGRGGEGEGGEKERRDGAFYDAALVAVKAQLDEVHAHILDLEAQRHDAPSPPPAVIHRDTPPPPHLPTPPPPGDDSLPRQLDAAHRQRKCYLAEKRRLVERKDEFYTRQRRHQQAVIDNRDALRLAVVNEAQVVCTTLTGAGLELFAQATAAFDCVVIDEAAQAVELQTLIPLKYDCRRFVLVGDDRQLSATVISQAASRFDYSQSLFSRLRKAGVHVQVIDTQYRMHPAIRAFPSHHFYAGQLRDAPELLRSDALQRHPALLHPLPAVPPAANVVDRRLGPYAFYDVRGGQESRTGGHASLHNVAEARVALQVFALLRRAHQRAHPGPFAAAEFVARVGVVTPYQQQVALLQRTFRDAWAGDAAMAAMVGAGVGGGLEVSTVDSFQGREKDFVIFSAVRAHQHEGGEGGGRGIGFVADANRLNVALTRARLGLYVLGSARTLGREGVWRALIEDARERGCCVEVGEEAREVFADPLHHPRWSQPLEPAMWGYADDGVASPVATVTPPASEVADRKPRRTLSSSHSPLPGPERQPPIPPPSDRQVLQTSSAKPAVRQPTDAGKKPPPVRDAVAAAPKKKTQPLPVATSAAPSPPAPSGRMKPPSPSALNANAISIRTMQAPAEEKKGRPSAPPTSEEPRVKPVKPIGSPRAAGAVPRVPSNSLRGLNLTAMMEASANPIRQLAPSGATSSVTSTKPARPPAVGAETSVKVSPVMKPKRTLSTSAASSPPGPLALSSTAVPPPQREGSVSRPSASASSSSPSPPPLTRGPSTANDRRSSTSSASPPPPASPHSTAERTPRPTQPPSRHPSSSASSTAAPPASGERTRNRLPPRDEIDVSASAPQDDEEDDVHITSSHVVPAREELEEGELPVSPSPAHPFVDVVRGGLRAALPAYSCEDCREFHRLMDRSAREGVDGGERGRYQPQTFEMACTHRIRQSAAGDNAHPPVVVHELEGSSRLCAAVLCGVVCAVFLLPLPLTFGTSTLRRTLSRPRSDRRTPNAAFSHTTRAITQEWVSDGRLRYLCIHRSILRPHTHISTAGQLCSHPLRPSLLRSGVVTAALCMTRRGAKNERGWRLSRGGLDQSDRGGQCPHTSVPSTR